MLEKHLIACPACDSLYKKEHLDKNEVLLCDHCGSLIDDGLDDFRAAFAYALTCLILFAMANLLPFITLNLKGETSSTSIIASVLTLADNGLPALAWFLSLLIFLVPLWYLLGVIWSIISFRLGLLRGLTRKFLHLMARMGQWNMLEVYLVAVLVTLVKVMQMADVRFLSGFWSFAVLIFFSILLNRSYDLGDAIFLLNDHKAAAPREPAEDSPLGAHE